MNAAERTHLMAVLAAEGVKGQANWAVALDHLQEAAELGHSTAQRELAALAGDWTLSREIASGKLLPMAAWLELRHSVDSANWLLSPRSHLISTNPLIVTVEDFATTELCDWLIERARTKLTPAKVYDHESGGDGKSSNRTNSAYHFRWEDSDLLLTSLRTRMAATVELPIRNLETTAVLHYLPGEEYLPHFDFFDTAKPGLAKNVAMHGQRILTCLIALNDDYDGGETEFTKLNWSWKGRRGSAIFFFNVEEDGTPDRRTRHAGRPTTRGEKWLLSQWMRGSSEQG